MLHESQAVVQLEKSLSEALKRVDPPILPGQKNPDFMFVYGPYAGKTCGTLCEKYYPLIEVERKHDKK